MTRQIPNNNDVELQFACQLYERCLELYGKDHEQTRFTLQYVASFEKARLADATYLGRQ